MQTNRRTVISSIASLTAGGAGVAALGTQSQSAIALETTGLTVEGVDHTTESGLVQEVRCSVDVDYSYSSNQTPQEYECRLVAGTDADGTSTIDTVTSEGSLLQSDSGSVSLQGDLLESYTLGRTSLVPSSKGNTKSNEVYIGVVFTLSDNNGEIDSHTVSDTATVTISHEDVSADIQLGGTGHVSVLESSP